MILRFWIHVFVIFTAASSLFADEGMWLFSAPPVKQLKEKYQFEPTPQWSIPPRSAKALRKIYDARALADELESAK